jgi:hypothetical protein
LLSGGAPGDGWGGCFIVGAHAGPDSAALKLFVVARSGAGMWISRSAFCNQKPAVLMQKTSMGLQRCSQTFLRLPEAGPAEAEVARPSA